MFIDAIEPDFDAGFLPFQNSDRRFQNFALLSELNSLIFGESSHEDLLDFIQNQLFTSLKSSDLYILEEEQPNRWSIKSRANSANFKDTQKNFSLPQGHSVLLALKTGSISLSQTNGVSLDLLDLKTEENADSYKIIAVPLIDGLTPSSILVAVVQHAEPYSATDLELLSTLQVLLSAAIYRKNLKPELVEADLL